MSNIIDSIRMSGTTYAISDSGGTKVVEITQSDYDNLPTSAKTANIMYVITDAEPFDVSNYYTKAETSGATELATAFAATQPKLSAGTNITIDANNVISAEGGGGKAVVGGRGITVTSGETADTVSFSLPISAGTGSNSVIEGDYANKATGSYSHAEGGTTSATTNYAHAEGMKTKAAGQSSHAEGERTTATTHYSHTEGYFTIANNKSEHASGQYNVSNKIDTTFGHSGNTLFSVGNGTDTTARHNAFEIRQNGDIYLTKDGQDIKLQDQLGGGGGIDSGTVQTMIDQSISGKTNQTDFVSHSGNTTMHVTESEKSTWNAKSDFSGNYNDLSNKPTIPTSASQLTNDSGYITSSALNGYATEAYVTAATNDMATKTWVGQQGYLTQHQDISGKQDVSGMTAYTTTATTNTLSGTVTAHTADTTIHVTAQDKTNWNAKSDFSGDYNDLTNKLSAGTNITIVDNVISAEGGGKAVSGGTNISITTGATADTINCTIPAFFHSNTVKGDIDIGSNDGVSSNYGRLVIGRRVQSRGNPYFQYSIGIGVQPDNSNNYCQLYGQNSVGIGRGFKIGSDSLYSNGINNAIAIGHNATSRNDGDITLGYNATASGNSSVAIGSGATADGAEYKMNLNNQIKVTPSNQVYIYNKDNTEMICLQDQLGGGGSSYTAGDGIDITNDVISVTGMTAESAFTAHTADTTIHVTTAQTAAWDAKSNFSGSYNDLTDKPTIPTSASQLTNDTGYITSSALDGYATTATTSALNNTLTAHTADTTIHVTSSDKSSWNGAATNASNAVTALGGLSLVKLTQAQYNALSTKDSNTLYVIVN